MRRISPSSRNLDLVAVEDRLRTKGSGDPPPPALGGRHLPPSATKPFLDRAVEGVDALKGAAHGREHLPGLRLGSRTRVVAVTVGEKGAVEIFEARTAERHLEAEPVVRPREFESRDQLGNDLRLQILRIIPYG